MEPGLDLKTLITKLIAGDISANERAQLYDWVEDENKEEEFRSIMSSHFENQAPADDESPAWETMVQSILSHKNVWNEKYNDEKDNEETFDERDNKVYVFPQWRRLKWVAAAAVITGILLTAKLLFFKTPQNNPAAISAIKPDVAPASNKAILILSDGQQIALDSAKNGQLAKFGNTIISKTDSGKLLYASSGSKATSDETQFNTLITPRGGIYQLTLPDGTKVWLNAASRIDYPTRFTGKKREVFINGEVYFEVAKDATHPFLVSLPEKAGAQRENNHWMQIEVLGTHFNVKAYDQSDKAPTRTTLLEGSIKISVGNESKQIIPGEQAVAGFNKKGIEIKKNVDLDDVMAWRNGEMVLTSGSVQEIMNEISRWYDMDIVYTGAIPDKQFYGSVQRDVPLSTVLHALEAYGVQTRVEGKKIIVQ